MLFADRTEAGMRLAERVAEIECVDPLVLALPRGGVPVAAEVARKLNAPLDVVFVRKLGAPEEPELAIGAIVDGREPVTILNDRLVEQLGVSVEFIKSAVACELAAIEQRRRQYAGVRPAVEPAGRTVIIVDDGVATGMTMQAALRSVRKRQAARLVAAVPVASREAMTMLQQEADEVICLSSPRRFGSVGSFYRLFGQVSDADVLALLRAAAHHGH